MMKIIYACMVVAASGQGTSQPSAADSMEKMDLTCMKSTQVQTWLKVQQTFQYILGPGAGFGALSKENTLEPALDSIMEDIASIPKENAGECAIGQLMLQLLKIIAVDSDGELIGKLKNQDTLSSPILTLLLDVPWTTYQPEWPIFGLLAQAAVKRSQTHANNEAVDGVTHPQLKEFASAMNKAIREANLDDLKGLSRSFVESGSAAMEASPIAFLTSVLAQAATAPTKKEAQSMFSDAQILMKNMITSPSGLEVTLGSRWPLWGMAYLASLKATV